MDEDGRRQGNRLKYAVLQPFSATQPHSGFEVAFRDLKQEDAYPYSDMRLAHCANSRAPRRLNGRRLPSVILCVPLRERSPLFRQVVERENRRHWADRYACAAVD